MSVAVIALAYALGCLNAGYYLVRWHSGRDIRRLGSGNAGARNVGRVMGPSALALVFVLDAAKGLAAVAIAQAWTPEAAPLCAVAATLGHVFPAQLAWRGGKGVATAIGALAALDIDIVVVVTLAFAVGWPLFRRPVPAGLLAIMCSSVFSLVATSNSIALATIALCGLLCFTHLRKIRHPDLSGVDTIDGS
jgi:glycerol-3-phosphate acyltransferase PlsY